MVLSNPSSQVVHNRHLVLKEEIETHPNWASYVKDIGSYIWATYGTASQNKQFQTNKKPDMLRVLGFYMLS